MIKNYPKYFLVSIFIFLMTTIPSSAQHSVARQWNEVLLSAIRVDYARPTVHARNLFHTSIAMYDAWAVYDNTAQTFFLGNTFGNFTNEFNGVETPSDVAIAQSEAISYAAYRLLTHRFRRSPGSGESLPNFSNLMVQLGYDTSFESTDYTTGSSAALGNYIAEQIIAFGLGDGSREVFNYTNAYYTPVNDPMLPTISGSQNINDPNRWQPLAFDFFIDQAGFEIPGGIPEFLGPEWGKVVPFSLIPEELNVYERDGNEYWVYHDPGAPSYIQEDGGGTTAEYQWGHSLVAKWSSHLDPTDGIMIDISPASIGNIKDYPVTMLGLRDFYKPEAGGDPSLGHTINPHTQLPYAPQIVPRGDYTRVLAEFWADGPDSETPPGHWFTILNYVNDHNLLQKRFMGQGDVLDDLEWDIKAYLVLSGAMHDSAVAAWGIKGWYDYIRPVSAIRQMADKGQSSDQNLPNYSMDGMPLEEGLIELVLDGDPLAGDQNEHLNKIKVFAWRGPEYIFDPNIDVAGVDWILAENWWPYQRPSFVTPPFAGYVSGHSTFSRAAAEVMTMLTGDEFFPGGMGEFHAPKNEFLVFEEGPSEDVILQWATYRDASDQTSLSRIWGGIHPPVDDIPGRLIGEKIGISAFNLAKDYFEGKININDQKSTTEILIYPNPVENGQDLMIKLNQNPESGTETAFLTLMDLSGKIVNKKEVDFQDGLGSFKLALVPKGIYILNIKTRAFDELKKIIVE